MKSDRVAKNTLEETRALADEVTALRLQVRRISARVFGPDDLH
jgi:hypothetical protein